MKNKGFTLIEVITVVTLLAVISLVTLPNIVKQLTDGEEALDQSTLKIIYEATENYIEQNKNDYPIINDNTYCITLMTLKENNNISSLTDSKGNDIDLNKTVQISVSNGKYVYELVDKDMCEQ